MKKVIVFRVENVLVKDYDEVKMFDLKMRRLVKEMLKEEGLELMGNDWNEMKNEMVGFSVWEIIAYSSVFKVFCSCSFESSGTIPLVKSIKHKDGYKTHHQFSPRCFSNFYF